MPFVIRDMRAADRAGVAALETVFETTTVLDVVIAPRRIDLVERALATPLVKRYPVAEIFAHWSTWDMAFVADDDSIVGFTAVEHEAWHARLVLWHLYVEPARRRQGIARALLERVESHGRAIGATHVWLETSNVNVPGIAAYERLGYTLCGTDRLLYAATNVSEEVALFLAKPL